MKGLLLSIAKTLGSIPVAGKDNYRKMWDCINTLEQLADAAGGVTVRYVDEGSEKPHDNTNEQGQDVHGTLGGVPDTNSERAAD